MVIKVDDREIYEVCQPPPGSRKLCMDSKFS